MVAKRIENTDPGEEIREAFRVFDMDRSGFVQVEEMRFVMRNIGAQLTEEEIEEMLTEADPDRDGRISYEGRSEL